MYIYIHIIHYIYITLCVYVYIYIILIILVDLTHFFCRIHQNQSSWIGSEFGFNPACLRSPLCLYMILYNIHIYIHINVALVSFYLPFYPILPNVIHVIDVLCTLDRCVMMCLLLIFCEFFQDLAEAAEHEPRFHL